MNLWSLVTLVLPLTWAASIPQVYNSQDHSRRGTWHLPSDHQVYSLFRRASGDGINYPSVGSPTWSSGFPQTTPDVSQLPKEWVDALNTAVAAGKIPDIPKSTNTPGMNPVYPAGINPNSPEICSATYKCRNPGDTWDAPDGYFAASFDDGPLPSTEKLLQFLGANDESATHFMIGINILQYPQFFLDTLNAGGDIGVHTWTHPYMTTLSNLEILGQLGWTSALIHNSTGGRVPKFWRPPYGDSDNRVRAIAKEIFGLETVIWNRDSEDWSLSTGGTTSAKIHESFEQWLIGPKSPGIITLEHELSEQTVQSFVDVYPLIKSNGWNIDSLTKLIGEGNTYQNAENSSSDVTPAGILVNSGPVVSLSSSPSSSFSPSGRPTESKMKSPTPIPTGNSRISIAHRNSPRSVLIGAFVLAASTLYI